MTDYTLTSEQRGNLIQTGYAPDAVEAAIRSGYYGEVYDSDTGEYLRPATYDECIASLSTAYGHIDIDGQRCYIAW